MKRVDCPKCQKRDITSFHRCDVKRKRRPDGEGVTVKKLVKWLSAQLPDCDLSSTRFERWYLSQRDRSRAEPCWTLWVDSACPIQGIASAYPVNWILRDVEKFGTQEVVGGYVVDLLPGCKL